MKKQVKIILQNNYWRWFYF